MVELSEVVGLGLVIFGTLSLLYGIALCYTVKVRKSLRYDDNYVFRKWYSDKPFYEFNVVLISFKMIVQNIWKVANA